MKNHFNIGNIIAILGFLSTVGFGTWMYNSFKGFVKKEVRSVLIVEETGSPTVFTSRYLISPIINETQIIIEKTFADSARINMLVQSAEMDVPKLKKAYNQGNILFTGFEKEEIAIEDIIEHHKRMRDSDDDVYEKVGRIKILKSSKEPRFCYDFQDKEWREMYFGVPDKYSSEYCRPFWWYLTKSGVVVIVREISKMYKCA